MTQTTPASVIGWTKVEIYRDALMKIKRMKPEIIAPGFKHGPQLLFDNCQRIADAALRGERYGD